jgi:hypothetical protein
LTGGGQRRSFSLIERCGIARPPARTVFAVLPKHFGKEGRWHFIVLRIGLIRHQCDRRRADLIGKSRAQFCRASRVAGADFGQAGFQQTSDAGADHRVGHQALLDPPQRQLSCRCHIFLIANRGEPLRLS